MRIGYSFWGYLESGRRRLVDGLIGRGHELVFLQIDRDLTDGTRRLPYRWDVGRPRLDGLIIEWCVPVSGRNTTWCGAAGHTCELHRQTELVEHYTYRLGLPTVVWDVDVALLPTFLDSMGLSRQLDTVEALLRAPSSTSTSPNSRAPVGGEAAGAR
ncbi:hypothetical protein [Catellatospora tritici]|uniref:hypothetical protein n=1 Tax=Catellatospora tritici TaxID=2851566 RepID=UPI001C2DBB52|nr:hypothetical protein [Catellatospora tritici]MBV1850519.1 hypothetical protein [Catellatospora tritici]